MDVNNLPNALDMTNEDYHADTTRISKSGLDEIDKSPAHYWHKYLNPEREQEDKDYFRQGSAGHCAVFEPNDFDKRYTIAKTADEIGAIKLKQELEELATAKGLQFKKAATKGQLIELLRGAGHQVVLYEDYLAELNASGKTILPAKEYDLVQRWRDAVHKHPAARTLLAKGIPEKTFFFDDQATGAQCKVRTDWFEENGFIVDLKTTVSAHRQEFGKSIVNYRYDVASAFYQDGFYTATGIKPSGFIIIAVEKTAPYNVAVYIMPDNAVERGRRLYAANLQTYMECKERGKWPGYSDTVEEITLPAWAR
jgi:exodeoxyribonuclease VIII